MNWDRAQGYWQQVTGKVQGAMSKLIDNGRPRRPTDGQDPGAQRSSKGRDPTAGRRPATQGV